MKAFGIVDVETGEVIGTTVFPNTRNAKLSVRHNYHIAKVGVAEVEVKRVGTISKFNRDTKKWEEI